MRHRPFAAAALLLPHLLPAQAAPPAPAAVPARLAEIACAYAAKVAASALFVSGRTLASVQQEELAPDGTLDRLVAPLLRFEVDRDAGTVTARLLTQSATALHVPGLGCTLLHGVDAATLRGRRLPEVAGLEVDAETVPFPAGERVEATPPPGVDLPALRAAVDAAFVETAGRPLVRTRAVVVVQGDRLLCERYADGYDRRMPLPGWSMSKSLLPVLLGAAIAAGKLDPDAPLPVPEWRATADDPRAALRLDDLLRMQSGLQWSESYTDPDADALRMLFVASDAGGEQAKAPPAVPPRTRFLYSSGTTNLLCRILRTAFPDQRSYLLFARDTFRRGGLRSLVLECDPAGVLVGSSFGFATARDWARLGMLWRDDGRWLGTAVAPAEFLQQCRRPTPTSKRGHFGAHVWLNAGSEGHSEDRAYPRLEPDVFEFSGFEGQSVVVLPRQRLVVVRLGCTKQGGFDLSLLLERVRKACGG